MSDQDDEKKILNEDTTVSESENQPSVDQKDQPESVEGQNNDPNSNSNENTNINNDQAKDNDVSNEKKGQNENLQAQDDEVSEKKDEVTGSGHEVIHKKDGRLHIYVRQDKYKGELKSKNWVGRLYHDGKQKISSSGTPNLEEAIPILEKWFDDVVSGKEKEK